MHRNWMVYARGRAGQMKSFNNLNQLVFIIFLGICGE